MISRLQGTIIEKQPPQVVLDVHGVGYEVDVSMQTFYQLPALGETVQLYTQLVVREDTHLLFGFADVRERATFRQLVKVSGIGAKTALGILSGLNPDELAAAVAEQNVKVLSSAPGIGKKTAERMILELRDKLTVIWPIQNSIAGQNTSMNHTDDVISTLIALGYSEKESRLAVKNLADNVDVSEGVKFALKHLMR